MNNALPGLRPGLLPPEDEAALAGVVHTLLRSQRALVLAECPPHWRTCFELVLAIALASGRTLRLSGPAQRFAPSWQEYLGPPPAPDNEEVWMLRPDPIPGLLPLLATLNRRRDELVVPGRRTWLWLEPQDLERVARFAPDLWRYRTTTLTLRPSVLEDLPLPVPVPAIAWPILTPDPPPARPAPAAPR